jgi:asparagine synthase (glutamine-hydrolysing)
MCGITGIVSFTDQGRETINYLERATDAISKRGPDSKGYFRNEHVGLGHRRLSIIDTSDAGCQPMYDPTGRYVIVFNGEIFNFPELRMKLVSEGVIFRNHTDTEVILQLYIREGKNFLNKLNGFWAFAIYDKEEQSLFIARDRMGVKPLLFFRDDDRLIFASEMKALMSFGIPKRLDYTSLYQYLQLNYIPGPASIFKGVKKLIPGSYMFIKKGKIVTKQWYKIPYNKKTVKNNLLSYDQQKTKLVELMDAAVQRRLISDVPLGAFLSGGIDSSVIVALASRHTKHLNTFSIGYKDEAFFDETKYANLVAKKYNTNHTVFSLTNQDLYDNVFNVLDYIDEPFADSSALPVYILSKQTRQQVTVALSGDGADEMFAGYNKHMGEYRVRQRGVAAEVISGLDMVWDLLPKSRNSPFGNKVRQFQRFAEGMQSSPKSRYWKWAGFAEEGEARRMLSKKSLKGIAKDLYKKRKAAIVENITDKGDINEVLYTDMHLVLQNDMLVKVDLMSMANSLEVRTPFLDYTVVDFAFSIPESSKINKNIKKRIVQDAFRDLLPPELYKRPKHGFEVPLLKWFRGDLRPLIEDELLSDTFIRDQGIFDVEAIRELKRKLFSNNPEDIHARIWGLIVFQHWWKRWME